jgi:nucleotide-binding universal stress UspA family protein
MVPFQHILVPLAFDVPSEEITTAALVLASECGAAVTFVHVYPLPESVYGVYAAFSDEGLADSIRTEAERALKARVAALRHATRATLDLTAIVRAGEPWQEILAAAEEGDADLIVMGTHGHRGVARVLLGSVAEKVVRLSPIPVLTIRTRDASSAGTRTTGEERNGPPSEASDFAEEAGPLQTEFGTKASTRAIASIAFDGD